MRGVTLPFEQAEAMRGRLALLAADLRELPGLSEKPDADLTALDVSKSLDDEGTLLNEAISNARTVVATDHEAVKVQDQAITLELVDPRRISRVIETIEHYLVPAIPLEGWDLQLDDRRIVRVVGHPMIVGMAVFVRAKFFATQPKPSVDEEDTF